MSKKNTAAERAQIARETRMHEMLATTAYAGLHVLEQWEILSADEALVIRNRVYSEKIARIERTEATY